MAGEVREEEVGANALGRVPVTQYFSGGSFREEEKGARKAGHHVCGPEAGKLGLSRESCQWGVMEYVV